MLSRATSIGRHVEWGHSRSLLFNPASRCSFASRLLICPTLHAIANCIPRKKEPLVVLIRLDSPLQSWTARMEEKPNREIAEKGGTDDER